MKRFHFRVFLQKDFIDLIEFNIYAKNVYSAYQRLFKDLGALRYFVVGILLDISDSDENIL